MYGRWRKFAAAVLATAILTNQCMTTGMAAEVSATEAQSTAAETQSAATEAPATEAQSAATEAPAAETQSAATEAPAETQSTATEAPAETQSTATEAPAAETQSTATEAPAETQSTATEAPAAETQSTATEAPATEAQSTTTETTATETQSAAAETSATEEQSEEEETKTSKEKESETELWERKNTGKKLKINSLTAKLSGVLPYLFAANALEGGDELLEEPQTVTGEDGKALVQALETYSVELANASSSSGVCVINLYADKNGKIDTTQLEKKFEDQILDVTKQRYVINIIANSAEQSLEFQSFSMKKSGTAVVYTDGLQTGDVLYNFAAMSGDSYTGYHGKLKLSGNQQGTFLAPQASVEIDGNLAGAVYADSIVLQSGTTSLLRIVFAEDLSDEAETETEPDSGTQTEPEETAEQTATEEPAETEQQREKAARAKSGDAADAESDQEDSGLAIASIEETASSAETSAESEDAAGIALIEAQNDTEATGSAVNVKFTVKLQDSESGEALEGTVTVKAAQDIVNAEGAVIFAEDTLVETQTVTAGSAEFGGGQLKYGGNYYLELSSLPEGYRQIARIYLQITENGATVFSQGWNEADGVLTLALSKEAAASAPVLTLLDENGEALSGAVFVIKDENGNVLKNAEGYAQYDIRYNGTPVMLTGLADGTYYLSQISATNGYQIAKDQKFTIPGEASLTVINRKTDGGKTIRVSAEVLFEDTVLTAAADTVRYAAVFTGEGDSRTRVSAVQELNFDESGVRSDTVSFSGLTGDSYYVLATSALGEILLGADGQATGETSVTFASGETQKDALLSLRYNSGAYPEEEFCYTATISIGLNVLGKDGKPLGTQETFYVSIFRDSELQSAVTVSPVVFAMNGAASGTMTYQIEMAKETGTYYLAETDSKGKEIAGQDSFAYAVTYPEHETGSFTVSCGQDTVLTVQNKLNDSLVKIRVTDASGNYLPGAVLAIKDSGGKVIKVVSSVTFESGTADLEWKNILEDGETYYLTEITAPSGYMPAADVEFTVAAGGTTEVLLTNQPITATGYQLSVTKQVYVGSDQVYAKDTSAGKYEEAGAYRYYFALFSDAKHTKKVSNVLSLDVEGFSGTVRFENLTENAVYYVAETNEYGEVTESSAALTVKYANSGRVKMSEKERTMAVQNVYSSLPDGYRYTGTLTIVKQVTDSSGEPEAVTKTFYAGIYRNADYSDTPTIVKLALKNSSSVSAKRRILLSGSNDMTYYIAEVDASGNRITDSSDFGYVVKVDQPSATVTKSGNQTVTITNKAKSSTVVLYISKKVYDGASQKKVSETFYAGLFKDSAFTQLYADPVELKLEEESELTLKLTLNLGSASGTTVYIAEVDKDGNVIRNERDFGYQIKIMNSTAAFDQDNLEIHTILLNSVYGSSSNEDWGSIISGNSSTGEYDSWSDNGYASGSASVETGDSAPVAGCAAAMGAALLVLAGGAVYRRRRRK